MIKIDYLSDIDTYRTEKVVSLDEYLDSELKEETEEIELVQRGTQSEDVLETEPSDLGLSNLNPILKLIIPAGGKLNKADYDFIQTLVSKSTMNESLRDTSQEHKDYIEDLVNSSITLILTFQGKEKVMGTFLPTQIKGLMEMLRSMEKEFYLGEDKRDLSLIYAFVK